ncbi:MAG: DUF502 domain-containing protein [Pseudomonadota bacterium]
MRFWKGIRKAFRGYFLIGLIVVLPFAVTIKFLIFLVDYFDGILAISHGRFLYVVPATLHPDFLLGLHVPGLGIVVTLAVLLLVGATSRNYFGKKLISVGDSTITRIPLLRVVYKIVKDVTQTYSKRDRKPFNSAALIEYPKAGSYTIAFVTGETSEVIRAAAGQPRMLNLFVPTTPNPTSGFCLMVPEDKVQKLDMTVEEAFKIIISGGMVSPNG